MTRKRFVKKCMSLGWPRNVAVDIAARPSFYCGLPLHCAYDLLLQSMVAPPLVIYFGSDREDERLLEKYGLPTTGGEAHYR